MSQFGKKSAKVYHSLYCSTEELQVALWTYMFFKLGWNKEKSLHILPLCMGQTVVARTRERSGNSRIFKIRGALIVIMTFCRILFQKSATKSRGVLHFVPLRRFYAVLFVPLFCRPREKCGTMWKTTWLHNVDNIRQKDIITFWAISRDILRGPRLFWPLNCPSLRSGQFFFFLFIY